jgi:hypothetical protein
MGPWEGGEERVRGEREQERRKKSIQFTSNKESMGGGGQTADIRYSHR